MTGRIVSARDLSGAPSIEADVVVCGGGAGGVMAARELATTGARVVVLEEGEDHTPPQFTQREDEMMPRLFQEMAGRRTDDLAILVLGGKGLGGSTIHNTNLCKRTAPEVLAHWRDDLGISGVSADEMAPHYEAVEAELGVNVIPAAKINRNNDLLRKGVGALGYKGGILSHNRDERCIGSGFCELGCAYDGKLNARRVLVPKALDAGATFHTETRVDRVTIAQGRVTGVEGTLLGERGRAKGKIYVRARTVLLAGSAVGSAAIALRSDLPDPHRQIGTALRIHPAAAIAGTFDERVDGWKGIPQSYECTELLDLRPGSDRRVWIVPSFAHPVGTATLTPGFGPELMTRMRGYPRLAALVAMVHDETAGRVYVSGDRVRLAYVPTASDRAQLALGARHAARILLAAGAREVMIPATPPIVVRSDGDLDAITESRFLPHDAKINAVHPMGTMRMGRDPASSVVDARGRHHHVKGLWVVDGSLFPTSIGGPPQISIYAFARKVAAHVAEELRG